MFQQILNGRRQTIFTQNILKCVYNKSYDVTNYTTSIVMWNGFDYVYDENSMTENNGCD